MGNNTSEESRPAGPRCMPIRPSMTASSLAYFYAAGILWFGAVALAVPPDYVLSAQGLKLAHVSQDNPMIYDNDWWTDVPDAAYLWAKASLEQCQLKGNIVSRDMWGWEKGYTYQLKQGMADCRKLLKAARASDLRNIPEPVLGSDEALRKPVSGRIEDTLFKHSPGSDLIVAEAKKASPEKPLLVFAGGPCTTVASAYLTDPTIADRMIVFQIDGSGYNGSDGWAWEIAMKRCRFANWARGYFWDKLQIWNPDRFKELPHNPLGDLLRTYAFSGLAKANQWGDGAWIFYTFDHRCLTRAEDYDNVAITVPKSGTNVKATEDEFFATMKNPTVYHTP
jgi:hypothetical protein